VQKHAPPRLCANYTYRRTLAGIEKLCSKPNMRTMKPFVILILLLSLILTSCHQVNKKVIPIEKQSESLISNKDLNDEDVIEKLIIQVLNWADSKSSFGLLPVMMDSTQTIYIGFNLEKHKENLFILKETGLFASEFIENYNQIILTIDHGLRTGKYEQWLVGDLPTFIFANDYSPWWNGQERFSTVHGKIEKIKFDEGQGEFYFICGDKTNECEGLENYKMKFKVIKEDKKWKISYLQGFDFKESTRRDGEL